MSAEATSLEPLGMNEEASLYGCPYVQVPPCTGVSAAGLLYLPIVPKCVSKLRLRKSPPMISRIAPPMSRTILLSEGPLRLLVTGSLMGNGCVMGRAPLVGSKE